MQEAFLPSEPSPQPQPLTGNFGFHVDGLITLRHIGKGRVTALDSSHRQIQYGAWDVAQLVEMAAWQAWSPGFDP